MKLQVILPAFILCICFLPFGVMSQQPATLENQQLQSIHDSNEGFIPDSLASFLNSNEHGIVAFRGWVWNQLVYPKLAARKGIQGRVIVSFIVEPDGSLSTFEVLSTPHKILSDEVIRILALSPKWTPSYKDGEAVRTTFTLPIDFSIP